MKKAAILLLLIGGLLTLFGCGQASQEGAENKNSIEGDISQPWVEVIAPGVFILSGEEKSELKTGDELSAPATIETDGTGVANIYLPDGSAMRLDVSSRIELESAEFQESDGGLLVKIKLSAGRVWSKIFNLATPASTWEVKTANAVATVRGTAFGVEFNNDLSLLIGAENEVSVSAIDPATQEIVAVAETKLSPKKILGIASAQVAMIVSQPAFLASLVSDAPDEVYQQKWVKRALEADERLKAKREKLKNLKPAEQRRRLRREILNNQKQEREDSQKSEADSGPDLPLNQLSPWAWRWSEALRTHPDLLQKMYQVRDMALDLQDEIMPGMTSMSQATQDKLMRYSALAQEVYQAMAELDLIPKSNEGWSPKTAPTATSSDSVNLLNTKAPATNKK